MEARSKELSCPSLAPRAATTSFLNLFSVSRFKEQSDHNGHSFNIEFAALGRPAFGIL